jgi:hypothetical protein
MPYICLLLELSDRFSRPFSIKIVKLSMLTKCSTVEFENSLPPGHSIFVSRPVPEPTLV